MGFKEAFTRQAEGDNLLFDDDAFYYFAISILSIVILPLAFITIKPIFKTYILGIDKKKFHRVPSGSNDQHNLEQIKKELKFKWLNKTYVIKVIFLIILLFLLQASINQLPQSDKIKGFDPYEILEIDSSATDQEIRKAYRRITLKLHPDKNPDDPQANQKFILLTKAYECLTDPEKKEVCLKYGNPDGQQSLSVGIAMPSFLLKKENRAAFLALIFLVLLVIVPVIVLSELKSIGKHDENGILLSNFEKFERGLEENLLIRKCIYIVCWAEELHKLKVKSYQEDQELNRLAKDLINEADIRKIQNFEVSEAIEQAKKAKQAKRKRVISKSLLIIYAHLFGFKISPSLVEAHRYIVQTIPKMCHSMINCAYQFSNKAIVHKLRTQGRIFTKFMGIRCINNILQFSQCIVQGMYESDPAINQVSYFRDQAKQHIKRGKMPTFQDLVSKPREERSLPNWVPEEFHEGVQNEIDMFPRIDVSYTITVDDDTITEYCNEDLICLKIKLIRLNTPEGQDVPFVHSNRFTYIKEEVWHIFLSYDDQVFYYKKLKGEKRESIAEFKFQPALYFRDKCVFDLNLHVISDSYRGLDIEMPVKFNLKNSSEVKRVIEYHQEDQELDKSMPFIQSMLNPMMNQQVEEDSDEDEDEQQAEQDEKKK